MTMFQFLMVLVGAISAPRVEDAIDASGEGRLWRVPVTDGYEVGIADSAETALAVGIKAGEASPVLLASEEEERTATGLPDYDRARRLETARRIYTAHRLAAAHSHAWGGPEGEALVTRWCAVGAPDDWRAQLVAVVGPTCGSVGGICAPDVVAESEITHTTGSGRLSWSVSLAHDAWTLRAHRRSGRCLEELIRAAQTDEAREEGLKALGDDNGAPVCVGELRSVRGFDGRESVSWCGGSLFGGAAYLRGQDFLRREHAAVLVDAWRAIDPPWNAAEALAQVRGSYPADVPQALLDVIAQRGRDESTRAAIWECDACIPDEPITFVGVHDGRVRLTVSGGSFGLDGGLDADAVLRACREAATGEALCVALRALEAQREAAQAAAA